MLTLSTLAEMETSDVVTNTQNEEVSEQICYVFNKCFI